MSRRRPVLPAVVGALTLVAAACGGGSGRERSAEAFCATLRSEQARILDQFNANVDAGQASGDDFYAALSGFGASLQALGELRTYFHKLADVAPEEIRTETELIAESYDDQVKSAKDAVTDPLGALGGALVGGFMISGQIDTVNSFALRECGQSL